MAIAHYTLRLMDELDRTGRCFVSVPVDFPNYRVNESVARTRIYNAASRLHVQVTTERTEHGVIGTVKPA